MDLVQPAQQAPATDDQELAKVLESMNANAGAAPAAQDAPAQDTTADNAPPADLQFEETAASDTPDESALPPVPATPTIEPVSFEPPSVEMADTAPVAAAPVLTSTESSDLDTIKKDALSELRPLVDKLDLPADEKFNTLLLIIRSTDDKTLVAAAHEAAKAIEDDSKRAEALLDVIKEIDYFANPQK